MVFVKEQRVDGSSVSDKDIVRCTLVAGKAGSWVIRLTGLSLTK